MAPKKITPFVPDQAELIWMEFKRKNISAIQVGQRVQGKPVSKWAVYKVLKGKSRSPRIRKALAREMKRKPIDLWPDYKPDRPRKKGKRPDACANI